MEYLNINSQLATDEQRRTLQDITDRKRAEEKLQLIAADLRESKDEIRSFAYIVSHDLRAPLVNLKGFSSELRHALQGLAPLFDRGDSQLGESERREMEELFQKDVPKALEFIESSANRMDRLITGTSNFCGWGGRNLNRNGGLRKV